MPEASNIAKSAASRILSARLRRVDAYLFFGSLVASNISSIAWLTNVLLYGHDNTIDA